jgi:nucleoside triphosphate diphosphatase
MTAATPSRDIARLLELMARLRTPVTGCPWDLQQNFQTIAPYTIEEAYEVADAIARGDLNEGLADELGDLLLQVVFHARMAEEEGRFDFGGVVQAITEKLIRRHPHVFGDAKNLAPEQVKELWAEIKKQERAAKPDKVKSGVLDGVPVALPALSRAQKFQDKAAKAGFDWPSVKLVIEKIHEEIVEAEAVLDDKVKAAEEIGDLLFAVTNLARHAGVDAESALREANAKFERRFASIEAALKAKGKTPEESSLEEMDALWNAAKNAERR